MARPLLVLSCLLACAASAKPQLSLDLSGGAGKFAISLDSRPWLSGSQVLLGTASSASGTLKLNRTSHGTGTDALGSYDSTSLEWVSSSASPSRMVTSFRTYASDPSVIVFEQQFPDGVSSSSSSSDDDDAAAAVAAPVRGDNEDLCRVTTKKGVTLKKSVSGYDAYTPSSSSSSSSSPSPPTSTSLASVPSYTKHDYQYCDSDHEWAYHKA